VGGLFVRAMDGVLPKYWTDRSELTGNAGVACIDIVSIFDPFSFLIVSKPSLYRLSNL